MSVEVAHVLEGHPGAPPLMLSNSLGSVCSLWDGPAALWRSDHRLIRYDHRGHGGSPLGEGPSDMRALGEDVIALMDRLELSATSFCGVSLGGMVGMWLAIHHPARIDRLVLCCTSARLGTADSWQERAATVRREGAVAVADAVVDRWLTPEFAAANPPVRESCRAMIAATPREGYAGGCEAIATMDIESGLSSIAASTLVIVADRDPSTPPEHGRRIAAAIPGARLLEIEDAAHIPHLQHPRTVARAVADHLA